MIWLAYLLLALSVVAEQFFCRSLTIIAKQLRMTEEIAVVDTIFSCTTNDRV